MGAEHQRAYVARQKAKDLEGWRERQRAYRDQQKAKDPEGWRERQRVKDAARWACDTERCAEQVRASSARQRAAGTKKSDPVAARVHRETWRKANLHKQRAHQAVARAIARGDLVRPADCSRCDAECKPQASHDDYDQPLKVEWLCQQCHKAKDRKHSPLTSTTPEAFDR